MAFGFGTNLVTASPEHWWAPFQPIDEYAPIWLAALLVTVICWYATRRLWRKRVIWVRSDSPYPGLEPFTADRAKVFFGRDEESRALLDRLKRGGMATVQRFIPLVGPSGSGKSSLLRAGVLPRLSVRWSVIGPVEPGGNPFLSLANALADPGVDGHRQAERFARLLRDEAVKLRDGAPAGQAGTGTLSARLTTFQGSKSRLLLVIDQWEDVVTQSPPHERELFLALLQDAVTRHRALHVLIALRPETLAEFGALSPQPLLGTPVAIGSLEPRLLKEAIMRPADAAGISFEPGLIDHIVAEAMIGDALPLVGHLLQRLTDERNRDRHISVAAYDRAGRVAGAIAQHADEIYEDLATVHDTKVIDETLLRFVSWTGRDAVRQRVPVRDLDAGGQRIVEEFRAGRLIVDVEDGTAFDLAHDALLRQWNRFHDLIAANEQRLRRSALIVQRAEAWANSGGTDDLLRGRVLDEARELAVQSTAIAEFVAASQSAQQEELARRATAVASRGEQLRERDRQLAVAVSLAAVAEIAPTPAAVLTLWSLVESPTVTRLALGHTGKVTTMAWLPGEDRLISVAEDDSACLWDSTGTLVDYATAPVSLTEATLSPNGARLQIFEGRDTASLWHTRNLRFEFIARSQRSAMPSRYCWSPTGNDLVGSHYTDATIWSMFETLDDSALRSRSFSAPAHSEPTWSPDNQHIAFLDEDKVVVIAASSGAATVSIDLPARPQRLSWSPDGQLLALICTPVKDSFELRGPNASVVVYDLTGQVHARRRAKGATGIAWSPDGSSLAVCIYGKPTDTRLELWDPGTLRPTAKRKIDIDTDGPLVWSHNSAWLAARESLGSIAIWDTQADSVAHTAGGYHRQIGWSPDRTRMVTRNRNALHIVGPRAADMVKLREYPDLFGGIGTNAWSPQGDLIVSYDATTIEVWHAHTHEIVTTFDRTAFLPGDPRIEWSPDGQLFFSSNHDFWGRQPGTLAVLSPRDRRRVCKIERSPTETGPLTWSPDSTRIAGSNKPYSISVWSAESGEQEQEFSTEIENLTAICWPANPQVIAIADGDAKVHVHDAETGHRRAVCIGHSSPVNRLCWSPDGAHLASSSGDRYVRLWNGLTGEALAVLDVPHDVLDLSWTPDSQHLVATTGRNTTHTWTLPSDVSALIATAEQHTDHALTAIERERFGLGPDAQE
ncbi:AAA family ATPase [Amycolatopsis keratiniphila]|uniref:nSTAND1 domain-containing NTPase n=1 Tax=Amycolatopsis keratiniphila TaxID=129921 RepID=UPI0033C94380